MKKSSLSPSLSWGRGNYEEIPSLSLSLLGERVRVRGKYAVSRKIGRCPYFSGWKRMNKDEEGFTLVELIIASAILSIIGLTIVSTFSGGLNVYYRMRGYSTVKADVLLAMEKMEKDKLISEDEKFRGIDELQKVVDKYIAKIDELLKNKEKEVLEF